MPFESAIPVNRVSYGVASERTPSAPRFVGATQAAPKQSVDISEDTLRRIARGKLSRMVNRRAAYGPQGAIPAAPTVGSLLSAKA